MEDWAQRWAGLQRTGAAGLWSKFDCLIALREAGGTAANPHSPRIHLRALSQRYPGALRELDRRPLADLRQRRDHLAQWYTAPPDATPDWVRAQLGYHGFVHAALRLRPALRAIAPGSLSAVLAAYRPVLDEPPAQALGLNWLQHMRRPPGGRISPVAYDFVGEVLQCSALEVERLVFG